MPALCHDKWVPLLPMTCHNYKPHKIRWDCLRYLLRAVVIFLTALATISSVTTPAQAWTEALIKPSRLVPSTSPGAILVVGKPSQVGTESVVELSSPTNWTVSATASDYTVSTTSLPAGYTAWPGISTATNVAGHTASFPSGNLTVGTTYAFWITGGYQTTPSTAGSGANYNWILRSTNGSSTIDTETISVPIVSNDQITLQATVPASSNNVTLSLERTTGNLLVSQGVEQTYTATYSNNLSYATALTIEVSWTLGTLEDSVTPSIEMLEYVLGSASSGYNQTTPVVDLIHRKLTWSIASIPANTTNQTVTFKLRTSHADTYGKKARATISGQIIEPTVTTQSSVTQEYLYEPWTASPTPASPSPTTDTSTTLASTPTPPPSSPTTNEQVTNQPGFSSGAVAPSPPLVTTAVTVERVSITKVTDSSIGIQAKLSSPAAIIVHYGTTPDALSQSVTSRVVSQSHSVELHNLAANTTIYFKVEPQTTLAVENLEIYKATTAFKAMTAALIPNQSFLTSRGQLLHKIAGDLASLGWIIIPTTTPLEAIMSFNQADEVTSVQLQILDETNAVVMSTALTPNGPQVFSGRGVTSDLPHKYQVVAQIRDVWGNLQTLQLAALYVQSPFKVVAPNQAPLEFAQVILSRWDTTTNRFIRLPAPDFLASNPLQTQKQGILQVTLPEGRYQAEVSLPGYQSKTQEFSISSTGGYPTIVLQPEANLLTRVVKNQFYVTRELVSQLDQAMLSFAAYVSTHTAVYAVVSALSSVTLLLLLRSRTIIPLKHILWDIWLQTNQVLRSQPLKYVTFSIQTPQAQPIPGVFCTFTSGDIITQQAISDRNGIIHCAITNAQPDTVARISTPGYLTQSVAVDMETSDQFSKVIVLESQSDLVGNLHWWKKTVQVIQRLTAMSFEAALIITLAFTWWIARATSLPEALPFIIPTVTSTSLWIYHVLQRPKTI